MELYPAFDVPKIEETPEKNNRQVSSLYFDFEKGDFALDGTGNAKTATPYDSWVQWCLKTIYTQRWAFMAYDSQTGIELEEAFAQSKRELQESYIQKTVTEALLADPYSRTVRVYNFKFNWGVDSLDLEVTVSGIWDKDAVLNAKLKNAR